MVTGGKEDFMSKGKKQLDENGEQYKITIASGNPVDGFTFHGPFQSNEEATTWAERRLDESWWIVKLYKPTI